MKIEFESEEEQTTESLWAEIDRFIFKEGFPESRWFRSCEEQEVYIRRCKKIIKHVSIDFIVVANIHTQEADQKKGHFTRFLDHLESLNVNLYVENVHNPCLSPLLIRHGFKRVVMDAPDLCYFKLTKK